jgi:hypothetical protein
MPALSTPPAPSASAGGPGPTGPPGQSAYSFTTAPVSAYDGQSNLTVSVQDVSWLGVTSPVFIPGVGSFEVTAVDTTNRILTLLPLKTDIGTPPYNIPSGTMVASSGFPGLNGATGNTGSQGVPGPQGPIGPQGLQGPAGQAGSTGATGPQGPTGQQGVAGPPGTTGATGATGPQGPIGVKGDAGNQGIQGIQGPNGPQGPGGPVGATGPQGPQGPPGPAVTAQGNWTPTGVYAQGDLVTWNNLIYIGLRASQNAQPDTHPQDWAVYSSIGIQGPQGATGPMGPPGAQGPQGVPGPQGPVGADGATGATGPAGAPGPTGNPGPQGATGATGATGPTGPTGPQGVPGPSVVWRGNWTSAATYNPNDGVSYNGSSYVAIATNVNNPPDTHPTEWQLIAQQGAVGPTGPQGVIGPAGPTGSQGPTGATGSQGPAGATGPPGPTQVSGDAGNTAMLGSDNLLYVPPLALATTTKIGALQKLSGNTTDVLNGTNAFGPVPLATNANQGGIIALSNKTTDFLDGTNHFQDLTSAPAITLMRLRSFNAIGNPTFEVDQRNVHAGLTYPAGSSVQFQCDRWQLQKNAATGVITARDYNNVSNTNVPGTNFTITRSQFAITVATAQATLATGEYIHVQQFVEGPSLRELISDVHSVSLLCTSTIALNFAITIRDSPVTRSYVIPCSVPANTLTLLTFPNIPVFVSGGNWNELPGNLGYYFNICLGCGTTYQATATNSWQNGNFLGYAGMTNFLATANASFSMFFVQHEPGALCTTPIDCPFGQNYDGYFGCLRYYTKSYDYGTKAGTGSNPPGFKAGVIAAQNQTYAYNNIIFTKSMAKSPSLTIYALDGSANAATAASSGGNAGIVGSSGLGQSGFDAINLNGSAAVNNLFQYHYTADTGW